MARTSYYTHDDTLQIGEIVTATFNDKTVIGEIKEIKRRIISPIQNFGFWGSKVGEEYNPLVRVKVLYNDKTERVEKKRSEGFDGSMITRLDSKVINDLI